MFGDTGDATEFWVPQCNLSVITFGHLSVFFTDAWCLKCSTSPQLCVTLRLIECLWGSKVLQLILWCLHSLLSGSKQSLWHYQGVFVASGTQTLTTRPPSSTQRKRNWVSRGQRSCSSTSCCPSHRFAAPGRGNQCIGMPASKSVSY